VHHFQASRGEFGDDEAKGQKEITLKDDIDEKIRREIYKNYLMYTMTGELLYSLLWLVASHFFRLACPLMQVMWLNFQLEAWSVKRMTLQLDRLI
jgi:hypothetical protein